MFYALGLFFLVCAVSMDSFIVGMTYGLRAIRVPFQAIIIIMCCSGGVVFLSMTIGNALRSTLTPELTNAIGGTILLCIGVFALFNSVRSSKQATPLPERSAADEKKHVFANISSVLATPARADLDRSGRISSFEAVLLGIALALDAFGAGFGASMLGYTVLFTTGGIALMSGVFLFTGIQLGTVLSEKGYMKKFMYVPACILICIGLSTFFI